MYCTGAEDHCPPRVGSALSIPTQKRAGMRMQAPASGQRMAHRVGSTVLTGHKCQGFPCCLRQQRPPLPCLRGTISLLALQKGQGCLWPENAGQMLSPCPHVPIWDRLLVPQGPHTVCTLPLSFLLCRSQSWVTAVIGALLSAECIYLFK